MFSQEENPSELQHSSEEKMGREDDTIVTIAKPFSIRQYVLQARQKDISNNWPFPDECLKVCLKHGVSRVLPPFEPCDVVRNLWCTKDVGLNSVTKGNSDVGFIDKDSTQIYGTEINLEVASDAHMDAAIFEVSKKVSHLSLNCNKPEDGEGKDRGSNHVKHLLASKDYTSNTKLSLNQHRDQISVALPSNKAFRNKRRKRKGKPKKRLLADIFADAKPRSLEDIPGLRASNWGLDPSIMTHGRLCNFVETENFEDQRKQSQISFQHDCRPILKGGIREAKHPRDDNAGSGNVFVKRRCVVKLNLNRSKSKLRNRVIIPPGTIESDWDSIRNENFVDEGKKKFKAENDFELKSDEELHPRYGSAGGRNLSSKMKQKMKVNFKGCKSESQDTCKTKSQNSQMLSSGTVGRKDAIERKKDRKRWAN